MKIDIDSIFYILLSIVILVVSGLGSRRRKQAQQMKKPAPAAGQPGFGEPEVPEMPRPSRSFTDPFEKLEQILMGQTRYDTLEGESLETLEDEEEAIVEEKNMAAPVVQDKPPLHDFHTEEEDTQDENTLDGLFRDTNEITRAIIYSEILRRKYT